MATPKKPDTDIASQKDVNAKISNTAEEGTPGKPCGESSISAEKTCHIGEPVAQKLEVNLLAKTEIIDTSHWSKTNTTAAWASKKIAMMEKMAAEGDIVGLKAIDAVPKSKIPNQFQKGIATAHAKLLAKHAASVAAQAKANETPPNLSNEIKASIAEGPKLVSQELNAMLKHNLDTFKDLHSINPMLTMDINHPTGDAVYATGWKKEGTQLGSNPGGTYIDKDGGKWYVKESKSNEHAGNEVLAAKLYEAAGIPVLPYKIAYLGNGKIGTATPWMAKGDAIDPAKAYTVNSAKPGFATHAWLGNWDAVGTGFDNLAFINKHGPLGLETNMTTLDTGGSLLFRAQGSPKGDKFGPICNEWNSLRDPQTSKWCAPVFGTMTPNELVESAKHVANVTDDTIVSLTKKYMGHGAASEALALKIIARKNDVIAKANEIEKKLNAPAPIVTPVAPVIETKPVEKPKSVELPKPEQSQMYITGKGPKKAQTLYTAALTGDISKVVAVPVFSPYGHEYKDQLIAAMQQKANVTSTSTSVPVTERAPKTNVNANVTPGDTHGTVAAMIPEPPKVTSIKNIDKQKKFDLLYAAAMTGDIEKVKAIPTNATSIQTYTKQQHKYKMSLLVAMGEGEKLAPGTQLATPIMTDLPGEAEETKGAKKLKVEDLPEDPKFESSKAANVEQNKINIAELKKMALAGDLDAIKATPTFPSPKVETYKGVLIEKMSPPPPPVPKFKGSVEKLNKLAEIKKVHEVTKKFEYLLGLKKTGTVEHNYGEGQWMLDTAYSNHKPQFNNYIAENDKAYSKLSAEEKAAFVHYKSHTGGINDVLGKGMTTPLALAAGRGIMKAGKEIPEGTNMWRLFDLGPKALEELKGAEGWAIQQPSCLGSSTRKDWPEHWNGNVHMKLTIGPGVRGLYLNSGGANSHIMGERELLLPPNTRFVVNKTQTVGHHLLVEVFVLPTVGHQCC